MAETCLKKPVYQDREWLHKQYIVKEKSAREVGISCDMHEDTIRYWLRKYRIPRRNSREYMCPDKLYTNKGWLYEQYVIEELSGLEIAEGCGVCFQTIYAWLERYDIECRTPTNTQLYRDKDYLYKQYVVEEMSASDIGKGEDVSGKTILNWLKRYNIPIRDVRMEHTEETKRKISESKIREKNPSWKGGPKIHVCENCGIVFLAPKCRATRKFCSPACYDRSGENNPNWNDGSSFEPYPIIFDNELREWIRNRDNRVCQLCGKSEIQNGRRLTVHHVDGNKANCDINNLIAVCLSCNSTMDTVIKEFLCKIVILNRSKKNMMKNLGGEKE